MASSKWRYQPKRITKQEEGPPWQQEPNATAVQQALNRWASPTSARFIRAPYQTGWQKPRLNAAAALQVGLMPLDVVQRNLVKPALGLARYGAQSMIPGESDTEQAAREYRRSNPKGNLAGLGRAAWAGTNLPSLKAPITIAGQRPSIGLKGAAEILGDPTTYVTGGMLKAPVGAAAKAVQEQGVRALQSEKLKTVGRAVQDVAETGRPTLSPQMGFAAGRTPKKPVQQATPEPVTRNVTPQAAVEAPVKPQEAPAMPPSEPPKLPTTSGTPELPSGRKPGGIQNMVEQPTASQVERAAQGLAKPSSTMRDKVSDFIDRAMFEGWSTNSALYKLEKKTGIPVFQMAERVPGMTAKAQVYMADNVAPVLRSVWKDRDALTQYWVQMRNMDIQAKYPTARLPGGVRDPLVVIKDIQKRLGPERFAAVEQAQKQLVQLQRQHMRDTLVARGLMSESEYTRLVSTYPNYIPFQRAGFDDTLFQGGGRSPGSISDTHIKTMVEQGSELPLDKPLDKWLASFADREVMVARNDTAQATALALQDVAESTGQELPRIVSDASKLPADPSMGTISFFRDGKTYHMQVPKAIAEASKYMDPDAMSTWLKGVRMVTAPLRLGATTFNIGFTMVNVIRDNMTALLRGKLVPLSRVYRDGFRAAATRNADFKRLADTGGFSSGIISTEGKIGKDIGMGLRVKSAKDAVLLLPRLVERLNLIAEQSTRASMGLKAERAAMADSFTVSGRNVDKVLADFGLPGRRQLAVSGAMRDTTINFSRMGRAMRTVNALIPFSNAGLHGGVNTIRTFAKHPKWSLAMVGAFSGASVLVWEWNKQFDSSKDINQTTHRDYWPVMIGEETGPDDKISPVYIKIPKAGVGTILSMPGELLARVVLDQQLSAGQHLKTLSGDILQSLSPVDASSIPLPPPVDTAVELATNYDMYRNRPIVPRGEQGRLPEMQFGPENTRQSIALGQALKVSPRKLDFAAQGIGAGVAKDIGWLADKTLGAAGYNPQSYGEEEQAASGAKQLSQAPVAGRFVGVGGSERDSRGWDQLQQAIKSGQRRMYSEFPEMVRLGVSFGQVSADLRKVPLLPDEQAILQRMTSDIAEDRIRGLMISYAYSRAPDDTKKLMIQRHLDVAREQARIEFWPFISQERKKQAMGKPQTAVPTVEQKVLASYPAGTADLIARSLQLEQGSPGKAKAFLYAHPQVVAARKELALAQLAMRGAA